MEGEGEGEGTVRAAAAAADAPFGVAGRDAEGEGTAEEVAVEGPVVGRDSAAAAAEGRAAEAEGRDSEEAAGAADDEEVDAFTAVGALTALASSFSAGETITTGFAARGCWSPVTIWLFLLIFAEEAEETPAAEWEDSSTLPLGTARGLSTGSVSFSGGGSSMSGARSGSIAGPDTEAMAAE